MDALNEEQKGIAKAILGCNDNFFITGCAGTGKCLGIDTPIIMYDGSIRKVQDIKIGEKLMGDDSKPRNVLKLLRGKEQMYEIEQVNGDNYIVTGSHILCLKVSYCNRKNKFTIINNKKYQKNDVIEITVNEYLNLTEHKKNQLKGYKVPIEFSEQEIPIDPYLVGIWLGDGSKSTPIITNQDSTIIKYLFEKLPEYNCYLRYQSKYSYRINGYKGNNYFWNKINELNLKENKHIPDIYKFNSRENRLQLLAGILDTDGYMTNNCYEIIQKNKKLADDIQFLARSLGFYAKIVEKKSSCMYKGEKKIGLYYRMHISGHTNEIPVKIQRKKCTERKQMKNVLNTGIKIISKDVDDYYGIQIDINQRFILGDFTVTHNSFLLKTLVKELKKKYENAVGVTALTGISALSINGKTLHSWVGLGIDGTGFMTKTGKENWKTTKVLIIDEISMLTVEYFKAIYKYLRLVQIIAFGDFLQLPPVNSEFCFKSPLWDKLKFTTIELKTVMRQTDQRFIKALNEIRIGNISDESMDYLENFCISNKKPTESMTHLFPVNRGVTERNNKKLDEIDSDLIILKANNTIKATKGVRTRDMPKYEKQLIKMIDKEAPQEINVKLGSYVMLTRNQIDGPFVNGSRGFITKINKNSISINFDGDDDDETAITKVTYEAKYKGLRFCREQYPLKLAYALTIHKSQGLTLHELYLNVNEAFERGQLYTGVSRICDPEHLVIDDIKTLLLYNKVSKEALEFYKV